MLINNNIPKNLIRSFPLEANKIPANKLNRNKTGAIIDLEKLNDVNFFIKA